MKIGVYLGVLVYAQIGHCLFRRLALCRKISAGHIVKRRSEFDCAVKHESLLIDSMRTEAIGKR